MSARIAPEPISIGVTLATEIHSRVDRSTRAIEPATTPADNKQGSTLGRKPEDTPQAKARTASPRPPGQDPSALPQTLFDAALIASENKPSFEIVQLAEPEELVSTVSEDDEAPAPAVSRANAEKVIQVAPQPQSITESENQRSVELSGLKLNLDNYESTATSKGASSAY